MEEGARNGGLSAGVVKNRNSTGCLIIKKKVDGAGGGGGYSGPDIVYTRKEKKRPRLVESESESSDDELLEIYRRRVGSNQVSTSGNSRVKKGIGKGSEFARKKSVDFARDEVFPPERKRNTLDVYDFDEYDDLNDVDKGYFDAHGSGRMFVGAKEAMRSGRRELETGSSRHAMMMNDRKRSFVESTGSEKMRSSNSFDGGFGIKNKLPVPALNERIESHSNEAIRLQGKNGVLKLMVKNKVGRPLVAKKYEEVEGSSMPSSRELTPKNALARRSVFVEKKALNDPNDIVRAQIGKAKPRKFVQPKDSEESDEQSDESEEPPGMLSSNAKTPRPTKRGRSETEVTPSPDNVQASRSKEAKVKRGSGTEKQLLREKIRNMLVSAGWTIDYRPRRNRDYFDAVYINPAGTAYWSIIKAYDALQKQLEEDGAEAGGENSGVNLISDDALSKLTRQTQKKLEKEMKRKNRENNASKRKKKAASGKFVDDDPETDCTESGSEEEKLSSFIRQSGNSKGRLHDFRNGNGRIQPIKMQERIEKSSAASSHAIHGRKTKKIGRCTLLVRNADKELNSEGDSFIPYKGKRTILSWLIDSGTVKLSEKVLYMNRRRTKVMLEGWITREGIHCGCCSKILTVSKFEIHAGSKLRQPYQHICLPSGLSLLQCQVDAWNSQDDSQRTGFYTIDVDGDDPNDDTCGICGDGGNLICCDGCPSTFHQSCLGIEMLPPGDWHCPHCSCKFCGLADVDTSQSDENSSNELVHCSLCERKYHKTCIPEMNTFSFNSSNQISFCGRKCQELFEQLQKLLGIKHDLESGLSWSLIHRNDLDADPSHRPFSQKVEWNAKLAVSLTVMDECFLPITDRRSGINLIQNVLYNCRSNFNRLNYGGFYTAILERGDEILSAASIRIHGNQLAEMPFIGTRHIYRRQGMCRRLLVAIESALRSLKVEKLIIPAISDMMHTWTKVFGFSALEELHKQEMKSLNMLVFPGTDMLEKNLVQQVTSKRDIAGCTGTDLCKDVGGSSPLPGMTKGSDAETSPSETSAGGPLPHTGVSIEKSDDVPQNDHFVEKYDAGHALQNSGVSLNFDSLPTSALDVPSDIQEPLERKVSQEIESSSELEEKLVKSVPNDIKVECKVSLETESSSSELEDKLIKSVPYDIKVDCPSEAKTRNLHATAESVDNDRHGTKVASAHLGSEAADGSEVGIIPDSDSDVKNPLSLGASHDMLFMEKPVVDSPVGINVQVVEDDNSAPSKVNDRTTEVDSASEPVADSNESETLTRSAVLNSAVEDSIAPVIDARTYSDSTMEPSGVFTLTPRLSSYGTDEPVIQAEEAKPDSSSSGNIQHHIDCESYAGSEFKAASSDYANESVIQTEEANIQLQVEGGRYAASGFKAADANYLVEAPVVSSNGTLASVPCSDSILVPRSFLPVQAVDHSQIEQQVEVPSPDINLISTSIADHESNGMQTPNSCSSIEAMTLNPIENKTDSTHENNFEVAGVGPDSNSLGEGST